jgi:hypothetical protein
VSPNRILALASGVASTRPRYRSESGREPQAIRATLSSVDVQLDAYVVSSFGIRIAEVRIFSPTPAMITVGVTASPPVR